MIIIWRGVGILVIFIFGAAVVGTQAAVNSIMHNPEYFGHHGWPKIVCCLVAAVLIFFVSMLVSKERTRNGQEPNDDLFFIPMSFWSFIILVLGVMWTAFSSFTQNQAALNSGEPVQVSAREPGQSPAGQAGLAANSTITTPAAPRPTVPEKLRLQAIFYAPNNHGTAEITHRTVAPGDKVLGYTVVSIDQQAVTLQSADGKPRTLHVGDVEK